MIDSPAQRAWWSATSQRGETGGEYHQSTQDETNGSRADVENRKAMLKQKRKRQQLKWKEVHKDARCKQNEPWQETLRRCILWNQVHTRMNDVMASKEVMLHSAATLSLDTDVDRCSCPCSWGDQDTCSDQPRLDRHHRARGHALDQSTLHVQTPCWIIMTKRIQIYDIDKRHTKSNNSQKKKEKKHVLTWMGYITEATRNKSRIWLGIRWSRLSETGWLNPYARRRSKISSDEWKKASRVL